MGKGSSTKVNETQGFLTLGQSNWTICSLLNLLEKRLRCRLRTCGVARKTWTSHLLPGSDIEEYLRILVKWAQHSPQQGRFLISMEIPEAA